MISVWKTPVRAILTSNLLIMERKFMESDFFYESENVPRILKLFWTLRAVSNKSTSES